MIPSFIISKLINKVNAITFGSVTLEVVKHDGFISRYIWTDKTSEVEGTQTSGECSHKKQEKQTQNLALNKEVIK